MNHPPYIINPFKKFGFSPNPRGFRLLRVNSNVNQAISTADEGSTIVAENKMTESGISFMSGVITFSKSEQYIIFTALNLDIQSGFAGTLETWLEESSDGVSWSPVQNTGKKTEYNISTERYRIYKTCVDVDITQKSKYRMQIRASSGSNQLIAETFTVGAAPVNCPSVLMQVHLA